MIRSGVIFLTALALTVALFLVSFKVFVFCGQIAGQDWQNYCKSVVPNVGVTGLQTLLVSFFVVAVADRVRQTLDEARRSRDLAMKRKSGRAIKFQELIDYQLNRLLYDFKIVDGGVSWREVRNARFVRKNKASSLISVKISDSEFRNVTFGNVHKGCTFDNVEISGGSLRNVSFRNCNISVERADKPFIKGAECRRLDFRNASLKAVDLSEVSVKGALFWGARIVEFSQMPKEQESFFREFVTPVTDPQLGKIHQVKTLKTLLSEIRQALIHGNLQHGAILLCKVLIIECRYRTA